MINKILTEALEQIENEQILHPEDYADVKNELDNLKNKLVEVRDFLLFPTLEQLDNMESRDKYNVIDSIH